MRKRILRWLPAVTIMVLIFIASGMQGSEVPEFGSVDIFIKKGGHMTGYALLAAACFLAAYGDTKNTVRSAILSLCLAIVYAASDEYHQSFTPGRSPSALDIGIDAAGAIIGVGIAAFITSGASGLVLRKFQKYRFFKILRLRRSGLCAKFIDGALKARK